MYFFFSRYLSKGPTKCKIKLNLSTKLISKICPPLQKLPYKLSMREFLVNMPKLTGHSFSDLLIFSPIYLFYSKIWHKTVNITVLQLNEYETAPYFFYWNKTWHVIVCWFLCFTPFLPEFTGSEPKIVLLWCSEEF